MPRRIAVVTTSRADWSHLRWPLRAMLDHPELEPLLIVAAAQLAPGFGRAIEAIRAEGVAIAATVECLLDSDTGVGAAKTIGLATLSFADLLDRMRPDLLLVVADRSEMLAPAAAALPMRIPVAHVEGGEASEGAIDHAVRNALTAMSHLHLVPTQLAARRVVAMGEEPWRVRVTGAPSLDELRRAEPVADAELERRLGFALEGETIVVAAHAVTLDADSAAGIDPLLAALAGEQRRLVFCHPNADAGSRAIRARIEAFCAARTDAHLVVNLDPPHYWALLRRATAMVGNSSSGIMESPALALPAVNVGPRQDGRERAANVLDAPAEAEAIRAALDRATSPAFRAAIAGGVANPYGDGRASERIAAFLAEAPLGPGLLRKPALDPDRQESSSSSASFDPGEA